MRWTSKTASRAIVRSGTLGLLPFMGHLLWVMPAQAQSGSLEPDQIVTSSFANPDEQGDGTLNAAAKAAIEHGPLPMSEAEVAAKAAITHAPQTPGAPAPFALVVPLKPPTIFGGFNQAGQSFSGRSPSDSTGAIGPSSYIQLVSTGVVIYSRKAGAQPISASNLHTLANVASTVNVFDPQMIWDPTTNRFYYAMDAVYSTKYNTIAYGFSKNPAPANLTKDWCHYTTGSLYGSLFPDYPKLGDSKFFVLVGVNTYKSEQSNDKAISYLRSDLIAVKKPRSGIITTCPSTTQFFLKKSLVDSSGKQVGTPVPANQIDANSVGYVVARDGTVPSRKIWIFTVRRNFATGAPIFDPAKALATPNYDFPPDIQQPSGGFPLDAQDARMTQAVQAQDPWFHTFSLWTQHTIGHLQTSSGNWIAVVRWYEIDPLPAIPTIKNWGEISKTTDDYYFNGAISPDRTARGKFGNSFVIEYNHVSSQSNIYPDIEVVSGTNGSQPSAYSSLLIQSGGNSPYHDYTCPPRPVFVGGGTIRQFYLIRTRRPRAAGSFGAQTNIPRAIPMRAAGSPRSSR